MYLCVLRGSENKQGLFSYTSLIYADELVLLAEEETVLQGMTDRLIKIGR
jgi:hypothetical protein